MEHEEFQGIAKRVLAYLSSTDQIFMDLPVLRTLNTSLSYLAQLGRL